MKRVLLAGENKCTFCGACRNACPTDAILPVHVEGQGPAAGIDEERCINCGRCRAVCPQLKARLPQRATEPPCYAAMAQDDVRMQSSSGGIFALAAQEIWRLGGGVCGAVYGEDFLAEHILSTDPADLPRLQRSKYMRSEMGLTFRDVRECLERGKPVLFVGCPCQVAGLYAFLDGDRQGLTTIDLLCHYAPDPQVFKRYLKDTFGESAILSYQFRDKKNTGWNCVTAVAMLKDGGEIKRDLSNDAYQQGYHARLFMPQVCEECLYSALPRTGDMTIGDFWYVDRVDPELDDQKGTSMVLVNSEKGAQLFETIAPKLKTLRQLPTKLLETNRPFHSQAHPARERFFNLLETEKFDTAVQKALQGRFDIGLVGIWSERNYGSELTYWALYHVLQDLGKDVLMIERPKTAAWGGEDAPHLFAHNPYPAYATVRPENKLQMRKLNGQCDTVMVGSDQIWHPELDAPFGEIFYLDMIHTDKRKIAYAASFGREYWQGSPEQRRKIAYLLSRFSAVSVREKSGRTLCADLFGVQAEWVLDPLFLCDSKHIIALAHQGKLDVDEGTLGAYLLDLDEKKVRALSFAAEKMALKPSIVTDAFKGERAVRQHPGVHVGARMEDWVQNFAQSRFVITDSFHGTCMAILFHKPFIAIVNRGRGATRFYSLLEQLGLGARLIETPEELYGRGDLLHDIDFTKADQVLEEWRERSLQWLKAALEAPEERLPQGVDLLGDEVAGLDARLSELWGHVERHEEAVVYHGKAIQHFEGQIQGQEERLAKLKQDHDAMQERMTQDLALRLERLEGDISGRFEALEQYARTLQEQLNVIRSSAPYRVARAVCALPNKIKRKLKRK